MASKVSYKGMNMTEPTLRYNANVLGLHPARSTLDGEGTALKILHCLFKRRCVIGRRSASVTGRNESELPPAHVLRPHLSVIAAMVVAGRTIEMILPAFPGKSPNRRKTLGHLPDLAERHAIDELGRLCAEIRALHAPGARIHICSDGYVFSDLVKIPDHHVQDYTQDLQRYAEQTHPGLFAMFDLKDAYPRLSCLESMREELMIEHGTSLIQLKERSLNEPRAMAMYRGITRFLAEDYSGLVDFRGVSNTQIQKAAKLAALRVIQRSEAWSELLEVRYPGFVRLSIHPQFEVSSKIGIQLVASSDIWRTPWHSVAVKRHGEISLDKRSNIDESSNHLVFHNGRPCHYVSQC